MIGIWIWGSRGWMNFFKVGAIMRRCTARGKESKPPIQLYNPTYKRKRKNDKKKVAPR